MLWASPRRRRSGAWPLRRSSRLCGSATTATASTATCARRRRPATAQSSPHGTRTRRDTSMKRAPSGNGASSSPRSSRLCGSARPTSMKKNDWTGLPRGGPPITAGPNPHRADSRHLNAPRNGTRDPSRAASSTDSPKPDPP
ncbi:hypothetical protein M885DRAFT_617548, partial [Pelagophyceae sp. CCMP2097]